MTSPKAGERKHITPTFFREVEDRAAASAPKGKEKVAGPGLNVLVRAPATYRPRGKGMARDCRLSAGIGLGLLSLVRPAVRLRGEGKRRLGCSRALA